MPEVGSLVEVGTDVPGGRCMGDVEEVEVTAEEVIGLGGLEAGCEGAAVVVDVSHGGRTEAPHWPSCDRQGTRVVIYDGGS